VFATPLEAKVLVEEYRKHYNHHSLHSSLGYQTPAEFAALLCEPTSTDNDLMKELESVPALS
jgi:transposase InsO family protein